MPVLKTTEVKKKTKEPDGKTNLDTTLEQHYSNRSPDISLNVSSNTYSLEIVAERQHIKLNGVVLAASTMCDVLFSLLVPLSPCASCAAVVNQENFAERTNCSFIVH